MSRSFVDGGEVAGATGHAEHIRSFRIARWVLGSLVLVLLLHLALATKPWDLGIEARLAEDKAPRLDQLVARGLYLASALNLVVCLGLFATSRWWTRPLPFIPSPPRRVRQPPWFWLLLLGAMLLGGVLRWPLAHRSLWWDEAWPLKNAILGERMVDKTDPGELTFRKKRWSDALWNYQKRPTNHVTFSAASRACLKTWQRLTGKERYEFNEFIMRLPAYVPALISIAFIGFIVAQWGYRWAGIASSFLLALHPWHIRYSADARCYSLVMLFALLVLWSLAHALQTGRARWWVVYGLAHFLLVWSFPYDLYLTFGMAAVALIAALFHYGWSAAAFTMGMRIAAANAFAGICTIQMTLPLLLQMPYWGAKVRLNDSIDIRLFSTQLWSGFVAGIPYLENSFGPETSWYPTLVNLMAQSSWVRPFVFGLVPLLVIAGIMELLRKKNPLVWPIVAMFVTAVASIILANVLTQAIYGRFLIYALLATIIAVVIGAEAVAAYLASWVPTIRRLVVPLVALSAVVAFSQLTAAQRHFLWTRPISPGRDVVQYMLRQGDPATTLRVGFGNWGDTPIIYDPYLRPLGTRADLIAVCRESREQRKPLYLFYCNNLMNRTRVPDAYLLLDDPSLFEHIATFEGLADRDYHKVFRYTGREIVEPLSGQQQMQPAPQNPGEFEDAPVP